MTTLELVRNRLTGFMHYYLQYSKNDRTMSTTADYDVTMKLATIDQPGVHKKIKTYFNNNNFVMSFFSRKL